jgi:hypothetical protein
MEWMTPPMKTPLFWLSLLAVLISCGGTPNKNPTPIDPDPKTDPVKPEPDEAAAPSVVGTVNLSLADTIGTQGTLIEPTGISFARTARALVTDTKRNTRYLNATFKVSNATGATLNNLRVYAVNTANSLNGTALFGMQNHSKSGLLRGDFARVTLPGHTMKEVSGSAALIDAAKANMILLTNGDAAAFPVPSGTTTLQYGFRTTETSIATGADGTMHISYRLPVTSSNTDDIGFSATFIIVKDGPNQVAQSPDESIPSVKARAIATGATELIYIGPSARSTLADTPAGVKFAIPLDNLKIGIGTPAAYLLPNYQYASFNTAQPDQGGSVSASTGPANACPGACTVSINPRSSGQPNTVRLVTTALNGTASISTAAPATQFLGDYKNLKVFVEVSNASKTEIVVRESTGELRYPIDASSAKTHTIDLSAPACLSAGTCTVAQVNSGLDKVTRIDLQIESNSATGASLEYGDLLLTDFQP